MITMPNIDQHIWNLEFLVADVVAEFQQCGSVVINLNNEGPDCHELGLYKLLDHVCDKYNIDKKSIAIKTCNLLERHPDYCIIIRAPDHFVIRGQRFAQYNNFTHKEFGQIKHFGLFIGRSTWQRLWISAEIFDKYREQTLQTFLYSADSDFHKMHLGVDRLINESRGHCNLDSVSKLINAAPIAIESVPQFPILSPENYAITKYYHRFLIEIVCETYTSGRSFFPTEKIWRPILGKTPFLVSGPVDFLKHLRQLGFKTFARYWDESYDEDGQILGTETILNNVNKLSKMSQEELRTMYNDMKPILDHNYDLLMQIKSKSFDIFK